jgi:hypothetical protein
MKSEIKLSDLPKEFQKYLDSRLDASMQRELHTCGLWWVEDLNSDISKRTTLLDVLKENDIELEDELYAEFLIIV